MLVFDRLYNFHWVAPGVARSAQPYLGAYGAYLKSHGIRSIINLRGDNPKHQWWHEERALAAKLGIAHFDVKLDTRKLPSRDRVLALFEAFRWAEKPILMKCSGGQDRTSLASALYLLHEGEPLEKAQAQFAPWPYLHRPTVQQLWMYAFPAYALSEAKGAKLAQWAQSYSPEHYVQWLKARRMGGSYESIQRPRVISNPNPAPTPA
jgi:protein tyrosine/serine phosphatase